MAENFENLEGDNEDNRKKESNFKEGADFRDALEKRFVRRKRIRESPLSKRKMGRRLGELLLAGLLTAGSLNIFYKALKSELPQRLLDKITKTTKIESTLKEKKEGKERKGPVFEQVKEETEFDRRIKQDLSAAGIEVEFRDEIAVFSDGFLNDLWLEGLFRKTLSAQEREQVAEKFNIDLQKALKSGSFGQLRYYEGFVDFADYTQSFYGNAVSDVKMLAYLPESVKEELIGEELNKKVSVPRYSTFLVEAPFGKNVFYLSFYDEQEEKAYVNERNPIIFPRQGIDRRQTEEVAEVFAKLIKNFQKAVGKKPRPALEDEFAVFDLAFENKRVSPVSQEKQISGQEESFLERGEGKEYFIQEVNRKFSGQQLRLLEELEKEGKVIVCTFNFLGDRTGDIYLTPVQLAEMGKLKFRNLESIGLSSGAYQFEEVQFSLYPDIFKRYEEEGKIDSTLTLRVKGKPLEIGALEMDQFEHIFSAPYHFYDIKQEKPYSFFEKYDIEKIKQEVAFIEKLFGGKSGEFVRRIIADSRVKGSLGTYRSDVDTLAIFAERSDYEKDMDVLSVVRHEMFHLIDHRFNISGLWGEESFQEGLTKEQLLKKLPVSLRDFYKLFLELPKEIKRELAEGSLDKYNKKLPPQTGHPWDNGAEFLASALNSLFIKNPEKVFRGKDLDFLGYYYAILKVTKERLAAIPEIREAPLVAEIDKRMKMVLSIIKEKTKSKIIAQK
jgi:hypothetical protein